MSTRENDLRILIVEDDDQIAEVIALMLDFLGYRSIGRTSHAEEAIAMAIEMNADFLLIDERDGRIAARQAGLTLTGVLGVLLRALVCSTNLEKLVTVLPTMWHFLMT